MKPESFIDKLQADPDGLDFEALRREGLRLVQEMSGDIWSDYNLHDPGVTILEQFCYGLTDAVYRCGFSAADYLASGDGSLDYARLALYRPDDILSCAPLTETDYRKLILGTMPNLDNAWIERLDGGLYRIYVLPGEQHVPLQQRDGEDAHQELVDEVGGRYMAHRNLCENLESVRVVEREPYELHGEIEIDGKREPAGVLAEIYAECARYLSPGVTVESRSELYKNGHGMEELFTGVATEQGYIPDAALHPWRDHFPVSELFGIVSRIEGVDNVRKLAFVKQAQMEGQDDGGEKPRSAAGDITELGSKERYCRAACLAFPAQQSDIKISLHKADRKYHIQLADVSKEFGRLNYRQQALRQRKPRYDWVYGTLPRGIRRELHEYYSVQNHFPDVYGLNANGVPASAGALRQAQALQLKAYLLLFEQVIANFLQGVQAIPALFSLDETLSSTCFHQVLDDGSVPGVERLYRDGIERMERQVAALVAGMDDFGDRRNRVLDYLLALYGEKFSQNSLRHFFPQETGPEAEMIRNKLDFLKNMVDLGRNRAGAFDYRQPAGGDNVAGLRNKLALLLGLDGAAGDLHIVEHVLLRQSTQQDAAMQDFCAFRLSVVLPAETADKKEEGFRKLALETVYMNCPAHIHPQLLWLDAVAMQRFGELHGKWLDALRQGTGTKTDEACAELAAFLVEHGERAHG